MAPNDDVSAQGSNKSDTFDHYQSSTMTTMRLLQSRTYTSFSCRIAHLGMHLCLWVSSARSSSAFARSAGPTKPSRMARTLVSASAADHDELPADFPRRQDVLVALEAVRKACQVTRKLQPVGNATISTVNKADTSPVTVADFCAQALVLDHLHQTFDGDSYIAEEDATALALDQDLGKQVLEATMMSSMQTVKQSIDLGKDYLQWDQREQGRPPRVWCLDPIDGTKGFLRGKEQGGQYCVALALLEEGVPTIGVLGCPNLPTNPMDENYAWTEEESDGTNAATRGCIFVASTDGGCYQLPLVPGAPITRIHVTPSDGYTMKTSEGRFCIGVEKFSDVLGQCKGMARVVHGESALDEQGEIVRARRFDSQAKYGILARAGGEFYARLPRPGYTEWIWDHAAGKVVIEEAGGIMTDVKGNSIDFSLGAKLSDQVTGILASNGGVFHEALVDAFRTQEKARLEGTQLV